MNSKASPPPATAASGSSPACASTSGNPRRQSGSAGPSIAQSGGTMEFLFEPPMTNTHEITRIRAALTGWDNADTHLAVLNARAEYENATDQESMTAVLAHIDAQAAEIERLKDLADSEGTRAVEYLRRARKAEAGLSKSTLSYAAASIDADRAIQSARHSEELLAQEITIGNLRMQQERKPMTEEDVKTMMFEKRVPHTYLNAFLDGIWAAETFHGIKETL